MLLLFFTTHFIDSTQASNFFFFLRFLQEFDSSSTENYVSERKKESEIVDNKGEKVRSVICKQNSFKERREKNDKGLKWVLFCSLERNEK